METLKIKAKKETLNKILEILKQFKSEDLEISIEESRDIKNLQNRFQELNSNGAKFISLEELDANLEKTISKYENQDS